MSRPGDGFAHWPAQMAFRHHGARDGFEVTFAARDGDGWRLTGSVAGYEDGVAWAVGYVITIDGAGHTRRAVLEGRTRAGARVVTIEGDGTGRWHLDGHPTPALAGCLDVDLEASALTNALPVRRLALAVGEAAAAPAVWVRVPDLSVERLAQRYRRLPDEGAALRHDYAAPTLDFACVLVQDAAGVVIDYPGIATRAG